MLKTEDASTLLDIHCCVQAGPEPVVDMNTPPNTRNRIRYNAALIMMTVFLAVHRDNTINKQSTTFHNYTFVSHFKLPTQ